jgi:hypothetical protein
MPILQFWTWATELYILNSGHSFEANKPTTSLVRCNSADKAGDWCGSIMIPQERITEFEGRPLKFIAISDAKSFTADECRTWNYYIPKERDESEWDLYYILLLQRHHERALWERMALGKAFQAAFGDAIWDEIKLG